MKAELNTNKECIEGEVVVAQLTEKENIKMFQIIGPKI